jgi:energy-coupling factor transporter ATP-binding protein EcfA2
MTGPPKPLRIKRLTLADFRAFPGPAPTLFDLDGKNLLVYGENGAGKSSIFHALSEFFSLKRTRNLRTLKNVFSGEPETGCAVDIEFNDGAPGASWNLKASSGAFNSAAFNTQAFNAGSIREVHPASALGGADIRVTQAALRRACLDYRALLDTNYKQGDGAVNLFSIALERLLADFPVPVAGGVSRTIGELWQAVEQTKPAKHTPAALARVNQACADFNSGFSQALAALHPLVGTLLGKLIGSDVTVAPFVFGGITYTAAHYRRDREIAGRSLALDVSYRTHQLAVPQHFLNEARLSALALAIYLAGRLACTPTAMPHALKLLVLDDVLIGLDHSNRLPLLDVLHSHFADWQVVLMTHDRNWFDLARHRLQTKDWVCCEMYEGDPGAKAPMPIIRPTVGRPARALLQKADALLAQGYVEAAANYARQSFELGMRVACELKKIKMEYRLDPTAHQAQDYLDKLKGWPGSALVPKADWDAAIHRLELLKNVVMNPYSHPSAPNIPKQEVTDAIAAVTVFLDLVARR